MLVCFQRPVRCNSVCRVARQSSVWLCIACGTQIWVWSGRSSLSESLPHPSHVPDDMIVPTLKRTLTSVTIAVDTPLLR